MTLKGQLERQDQEGRSARRIATVILIGAAAGTLAYFGLMAVGKLGRDRIRERERTPQQKAFEELSRRSADLNMELAAAEAELDRYTYRKDLPGLTPEEVRECEVKIAHWRKEVGRRQAACDELMHELLRLVDQEPGSAEDTGGE
ncbi:MAG: hypothetical protein ACYSX0_11975 [Planctomycetota bacterium]|jgi:hypothetical protein